MTFSLDDIVALLLLYKYVFLFVIVALEGPIATIIAGFVASLDQLHFFAAYMVILVADIVGDAVYYAIGYWGRHGFIERWGKYVGLHAQRIAGLERHFANHAGKTLMIGKISHGIGGPILVAAGIAKIPLSKFLAFNTAASIPKTLVLLIVGYYFGHAYTQIDHYFTYAAVGMLSVAIFTAVMYTVIHKLGKKYES